MSPLLDSCRELFGSCCGVKGKKKVLRRTEIRVSVSGPLHSHSHCGSSDFDDGPSISSAYNSQRRMTGNDRQRDGVGRAGESPAVLCIGEPDYLGIGIVRQPRSQMNNLQMSSAGSNASSTSGGVGGTLAHHGTKARRKEKDSSSGPSGVGPGSSDEGKLYLESALLERHLNETDLIRLVGMPSGFEENEWMASHTIALFEHVNLIYGTVSEFCTSTSCPDMTGPCMRTYLWFDEKGKKVKVAAPQYIDYVMTFIQKTINDESIFPTKSTNAFPSSFKPIVKKIHRLMFHVIAHIYHCHFKEIVLLNLHAHLNCVFAHFTIFNETFKLVEEKETEILQDLSLAMKLRSDLVEDDPMNESNKENILSESSSSSGHTMFPPPPCDSIDPSASSLTTSSSASTFNPSSDDTLLIKDAALVNIATDSH